MGGKNKQNAENSGKELSNQGSASTPPAQSSPQTCGDPNKHWIGVCVKDDAGNLAKDVTVHLELTDGALDLDMASAAVGQDGVYRTNRIYDSTTCKFSFPDLYDVDWWPEGETAPDSQPEQDATVGTSECILSVAERLGLREYHDIWDRANNKTLKNTRPNPNMLVEQDALKAPSQKGRVVSKATDCDWTFVVRARKPAELRMVLTDQDGKPLADRPWQLINLAQKGKTGTDGLIEVRSLEASLSDETLAVIIRDERNPPAPPAPVIGPQPQFPYPPPIVEADFKNLMPNPDYSFLTAEWKLTIGGMPPHEVKEGVLARLHNLGFTCGPDSADDEAAKAVKAYQRFYLKKKDGSGIPADIQADIQGRHDKP
jgi:hypothetical protein